MNIVFFGTPDFACPSLEAIMGSRHRVAAIVSQPPRPQGRGRKVAPCPTEALARERGIEVFTPDNCNDPAFIDTLAALEPDAACVVAYGQFLGKRLRDLPRHGAFNLHMSLLPKYRGAAPVAHAILMGEKTTGATIFKLVREMDAGPVAARVEVPIPDDIDTPTMTELLSQKGAELWPTMLDEIEAGTLELEEQDPKKVTYAPLLQKLDGHVDWTAPPRWVINHVRAMQGWPGAFTDHIGEDNRVKATLKIGRCEEAPAPEEKTFPGTVVSVDNDGPVVACRGGAIRLTRLQAPGHKMLDAQDFVNGYPLTPGERFM